MAEHDLIRVVVVDVHDMVRLGLSAYFKTFPDISLIGEAGDGLEGMELCQQLQPDVVLMT